MAEHFTLIANMVRPDRQTAVYLHEHIGLLRPTPDYAARLEELNRNPGLKLDVRPSARVDAPLPGHVLVNVLLRPINSIDIMWYAKGAAFLGSAAAHLLQLLLTGREEMSRPRGAASGVSMPASGRPLSTYQCQAWKVQPA